MQKFRLFTQSLSLFGACLAAFSLAFPREFLNIAFSIWIVCWGLEVIFSGKYSIEKPNKSNIQLYLLVAFFAWMIVSLLWTDNMERAGVVLTRRLSFVIFPLFALLGMAKQDQYRKILFAFVCGTVISVVIAIIYSYIKFSGGANAVFPGSYFFYFNDYNHRTYFSLAMIFSLIFLVYLRPNICRKLPHHIYYYIIFSILYILFSAIIFWAGGRMSLIILFLVTIAVAAHYLWEKGWKKSLIIGSILFLIAGGIVMKNHPRMQKLEFTKEKLQAFDPRYDLWTTQIRCIEKSNPVIGIGVGDVIDVFNKEKHTDFMKYFQGQDMKDIDNCHNQYLDTQLELGFMGVILLLSAVIFTLIGVKGSDKRMLISSCVFVWVLFMMIEPITVKSVSIYMFAFTLVLAYWVKQSKEQ